MGRRDRRHGGRRSGAFLRWAPVVLVLALLASAGAAYRFDLGPRWFGTGTPTSPAEVAPPEGLELPGLTSPDLVAQPASGPPATTADVRRALAPLLDDDDLGSHVVAAVAALDGTEVFGRGAGTVTPASTLKLLTAAAALEALGPDHRFATTVVATGRRVVLVGGGDPLLARAPDEDAWPARTDVVSLARSTAAALEAEGRRTVRVEYDDSLFSGPALNPAWPADYVPYVVTPISSLWVDEGRVEGSLLHSTQPSYDAAVAFADALAAEGITVSGRPRAGTAPAGATEVARGTSAPLSELVEHTLSLSDNEAAEVLARQVGLAVSGTASFRAGAAGVRETLAGLGVPLDGAVLKDGSGLSRKNLVSADTLVAVLALAADDAHPELRPVLTGLPVAGFSGSLELRFVGKARPGRGLVRAKTGTLSGVSALAGIVDDADGTPLVFAVLADGIDLADTEEARDALDDLAAALARCACAA